MISPVFSYGRSSPKVGCHWMTDFSSRRPAETKDPRSDSEHLLPIHPDSRVDSAAAPLPLLDFLGAIRKSTERFTRIHWLNPRRIREQERAGRFRSGGLKARTDLNRPLPIAQNMGFFETFFFLRLHSGKIKYSHPLSTTRLY